MLSCFNDYIGLLGCGSSEPHSGIYLNSLPGITTELLDLVASREQLNYTKVWSDVQLRAVMQIKSEVRRKLQKKYSLKSLKQIYKSPSIIGSVNMLPYSEYRGLKLVKPDNDYLQINISKIKFYNIDPDLTSIDILFLDTNDFSEEIFPPKTINNLVLGWNTLSVNLDSFAESITIVFDASSISSATTNIIELQDNSCCCVPCYHKCFDDCDVSIYGFKSDLNFSNESNPNNTFGLGINFSAICSFDNLICESLILFTTAYWYLLGVEVINEALYTNRVNRNTTTDRQKYQELQDYYNVQFETEIANAVDGIYLDNTDNCCFECLQIFKSKQRLP